MKLHNFYRKFEDTPRDDRFEAIITPEEPTSLFVIFKQLQQVRAQKRYFEDRERHLLELADVAFKKLEEKKKQENQDQE